ncbi:MAG: AraC family ligand binding domain-containing protein, partial [Verrucomicrobiales bacterium]|nr:AraC family ligand binding domain-containing protein [Verrucomicrobiales bacterium]
MNQRQKGEGFPGQRIVVLPRPVILLARERPVLRGLLPTDVGYFPRARGHFRERPRGADQAIFIHCARGAGWCEMAGERHLIQPGEVLVIPPATGHAYGADTQKPWSIHWFHAQGALVADYLAELQVTRHRPVLYLGNDPRWLALFEEVLDTLEHGYAQHQLLLASHALAHLLAVMVRHRHVSWREQPDAAQRVMQTIAYMKQHLNRALSLDALAVLAGLSRSRYTALFKEHTGFAPIDYLNRLRMHRACQLLDTTELSVKTIAAQLGYEDPLYFSRLFRLVNDASP